MSKKKVEYVLLVDQSGSMSGREHTTYKGIDDIVTSLASSAKENDVDAVVSVIEFNDYVNVKPELQKQDPETFPPASTFYTIAGGTAIRKAMRYVLAEYKPDEGSEVVLALFTDGGEGDSSVSSEEIAGLIGKRKNFTVLYVSPDYNAHAFAEGMNVRPGNVLVYENDVNGMRTAFSKLSRGVERFVRSLATGGVKKVKKSFFGDLDAAATMKIKKMQVIVNMPKALKSQKKDGEEVVHGLPPSAPVEAFVVDEYPACPSNWMNGSAKAASYFVAAKEGHGMWLDLNGCDPDYEVAAVVSVQGVNPITGKQTKGLGLEQYEGKCPTHGCDFKQDRFCPECKFKWPAQNYITTKTTPKGRFWIDGFRSEDGKVRQWVFTEETARGVAAGTIGDERVYAIGIAFYRSKKKKKKVKPYEYHWSSPVVNYFSPQHYNPIPSSGGISGYSGRSGFSGYSGCSGFSGFSGAAGPMGISGTSGFSGFSGTGSYVSRSPLRGMGFVGYTELACSSPVITEKQLYTMNNAVGFADTSMSLCADSASVDQFDSLYENTQYMSAPLPVLTPKNYEVAAGATIDQRVYEDTEELTYWEEQPVGFVYINYTDEETVRNILAAGKREEKQEGFLAGIPVGN
jgi:uncharacterized protein YegL